MKLLIDELPSHSEECIFSESYWDFDLDERVYKCTLSKGGCNCPDCEFLEVKKDEE